MKQIGLKISEAIKEGKWLSIKYDNVERTTYFWVAVISIKDIEKRKLGVKIYNETKEGRFLDDREIFFDKISRAEVLEGTTYEVPVDLIEFIELNIKKLPWLQYDINHFNILNYYKDCVRYDKEPYQKKFALIEGIDDEVLRNAGKYHLSLTQVDAMISRIKNQNYNSKNRSKVRFYELVINILSIVTSKGLFVIAYKNIYFNPEDESLVLGKEIRINSEFLIDGQKHSLYTYLDNEVLDFHHNYINNQKEYHELISEKLRNGEKIDEKPYLMELIRDMSLDLYKEFNAVIEAEKENKLSVPLKAFFGLNTLHNRGRKDRDIMLIDDNVNIDQLRVIHNALKNPITYVQGPPGTGKTYTILNVIVSAFFNNSTILITSNNNKPIDGILEKIRALRFQNKQIPIPIIRLGNNDWVLKSINEMKSLYEEYKNQTIFSDYLDKNKEIRKEQFKALNDLLNKYEEKQVIEMRLSALQTVYEKTKDNLRSIVIQDEISKLEKRLSEISEIEDSDALVLLQQEDLNFYKWLYYTSIEHIKRLSEPKYEPLLKIIYHNNDQEKVREFNKYLQNDDNLSIFLRVFPFIATTNISASRIGSPKIHFDLMIMDEAGQCSIGYSLVPIIRAKNILLVGDQSQLEPVIVLEPNMNKKLMEKYEILPEYSYLNNSILKLMQSIDHISKFILLRFHYRSHSKIINFSNKKYYDDQLKIETKDKYPNSDALTLLPIKSPNYSGERNTSEIEIDAIIEAVKANGIKNFGVITPFRNQAILAQKKLASSGLSDAEVGTIHTFQGDEKDVIFISSAITSHTPEKTFEWVKNNRELINVATTRAKSKLIIAGDYDEIKKRSKEDNDLIELMDYVKTNGKNDIKVNVDELYKNQIRGFKNYNTETENEFLETISHYLTINDHYYVKDKVKVSSILDKENIKDMNYYLTSEFDFVVFEKTSNRPVLAFELDGLEHTSDPKVKVRDEKKEAICKEKGLLLKRIPNSYARRYEYIKDAIKSIFKA